MTQKDKDIDTKMVGWYEPTQLLDTAKKTVISTIIGENADPRLVNAPSSRGKFFDYSKQLKVTDSGEFEAANESRDEIWIDYVADVGDGFNSTYSVAYTLAQKTLEISGKTLERGEILVFGGDEVYPTPTDDFYKEKLIEPYKFAFNSSRVVDEKNNDAQVDLRKNPHVFAIPGNHDWYDSLVCFHKVFCTSVFNNRIFADAWQTRQKRGYFALKLPHKWWLLGIDYQLSHSIDVKQLEYFQLVTDQMQAGDKVILCVPEPYWVNLKKYNGVTDYFEKKEKSIQRFEKYLNDKFPENPIEVRVYVAGDLHHYRRFESTKAMPHGGTKYKITAGGGGAFLHPTHDFDFKSKEDETTQFALQTEYPSFTDSKSLDWKNLYGFIFNNKKFGIFTAILYSLLAFLIRGDLKGAFSWKDAFEITVSRLIEQPLALLVLVAVLLGLVFFTDSKSTWYRRIAGTIHGLAHLKAIFFLGWFSYLLSIWVHNSTDSVGSKLIWIGCIVLVCGVGGYIIGSIIMGVYLFISLHIFHRHSNETFSAMKIEDFKNFLRLHIDKTGNLTIYPIKIEKVSRAWVGKKQGRKRYYVPQTDLKPELIEEIKPIV